MLSDFRMSALCFAASTSEQKKMLKSTSSKRQDVFLELNALAFDHKRDGPDGGKAVGQWVTAPFNLQMTAKSSHVNVLTWGTWGEDHFHMHQRVSAIINTILEHEPGLDVVALQEVNLELHNQLRSNKEVRKHWILTDFIASVEHSQSQLEGNLIMIRKSFAQQFSHIKTAVICTSQSPEHPMTVVEFWRQEQVKLRILTSSFKHQRSGHDRDLKTAVKTLNQSMMSNPFASVGDGAVSRDHASICLGHFDVREYSELSPLLTHAFQDVDAALRPFSDGLSVGGPDEVFLQELLAGYPTYPVHYNKSEEGQLRQDLIFIKGHREVQPVEAGRVGRRSVETVIDTDPDERLFDKRSKDGKVYPSNHLGVFCKVAF